MSKITCGGLSLSYSFENHKFKLSQLTILFGLPAALLQIQITLRKRSKNEKTLGYESGAQVGTSDGKRTVGKRSCATIPLKKRHNEGFGNQLKMISFCSFNARRGQLYILLDWIDGTYIE
jgi:hypothetical protein